DGKDAKDGGEEEWSRVDSSSRRGDGRSPRNSERRGGFYRRDAGRPAAASAVDDSASWRR
ncbi:hypothetical protein GGI05_006235, partial [Coemansia sp. RSA 2603]